MRRLPDPSEAEFQDAVLQALKLFGYLRTSIRRSDGVTLGDSGLPDIITVHPRTGALGFVELKVNGREATPAQARWLGALSRADFAGVVTPESWARHDLEVFAELARSSAHRRTAPS